MPSYLGRVPMFSQEAPACPWPSSTSTVPITSLADLIRQRDEIFNIIDDLTRIPQNASGENKPYRCAVPGCDKAYKNPNGLKYHNLHGHSSSSVTSSSCAGSGDATGAGDGDGAENKPYVCTFLECGKRYKNLNGLKYHIEHTHPNFMAALRAHQSGLINHPLLLQLAPLKEHHHDVMMTLAAALAAVEASPMMAMAANAVLQSAATSAANHLNGHGATAVHIPNFGSGSSSGCDARSLNALATTEPARGTRPESAAASVPATTLSNSLPAIPIASATLISSDK
ncbi:Transcriptional regulator of ribosomal biogenesis proteins [Mortierella alpina]|nr:Transcriptional regulator of ribosomal biogenesis proteins [Mortierella alpina]